MSSQLPICKQLLAVSFAPLLHESQCAPRKFSCNRPGKDFYCDFKSAVGCMKMGWFVIAIKHGNDNTKKPRYLGHYYTLCKSGYHFNNYATIAFITVIAPSRHQIRRR